jgi:hypothetical protein
MKQSLSVWSFSFVALMQKLKYFWKETIVLIKMKERKEKRNHTNHPHLSIINYNKLN